MTLDGMDTAKFRVPRNIAMTKEFSEMTRAELKLTGRIAEGISESYYLVGDAAANPQLVSGKWTSATRAAKDPF